MFSSHYQGRLNKATQNRALDPIAFSTPWADSSSRWDSWSAGHGVELIQDDAIAKRTDCFCGSLSFTDVLA